MAALLEPVAGYPVPARLFAALGAALLFVMQRTTERASGAEFARRAKRLNLAL